MFPERRGERFEAVEPLAACLSVLPQVRWERFGVVEPLAAVLSVLPQARWERFGVVEPLAACLSTKRVSLCVLRPSRCERFGVVEPLAAVLSPKAAARSSVTRARFANVEGLCERRRTLRVEASDGCLSSRHRCSSGVHRSAPGALAPVRVIVSRSIDAQSAPCAPLAGTSRSRRGAELVGWCLKKHQPTRTQSCWPASVRAWAERPRRATTERREPTRDACSWWLPRRRR